MPWPRSVRGKPSSPISGWRCSGSCLSRGPDSASSRGHCKRSINGVGVYGVAQGRSREENPDGGSWTIWRSSSGSSPWMPRALSGTSTPGLPTLKASSESTYRRPGRCCGNCSTARSSAPPSPTQGGRGTRSPRPARTRAYSESQSRLTTVAEREGFEPSVEVLPLRRFSKPLPSAARPPLHISYIKQLAPLS